MENNSRRHTKKAHISRPAIDTHRQRNSQRARFARPISTTARTNNERTNGRTVTRLDNPRAIIVQKKAHAVLAKIRERRERSTSREEAETRLRGPKRDRLAISVYGIFDVAQCSHDDEISDGGCNFIKRQSSECQ